MNFTKSDLKQAFSSTYFARGQTYFRQGMVLDVDVYEQGRSTVSCTAEVENSVEEKIIAMQEKKKALADAAYQQGKKKDELVITSDDMQALFTPLI